jgi:hypothetical protein
LIVSHFTTRSQNHKKRSHGVDGRKYWARRFEENVRLILSELGGAERLSAGEQGLVRQAATLMIAGDQISARAASGGAVDADALIRATSEYRRLVGVLRSIASARSAEERAAARQAEFADFMQAKYGTE